MQVLVYNRWLDGFVVAGSSIRLYLQSMLASTFGSASIVNHNHEHDQGFTGCNEQSGIQRPEWPGAQQEKGTLLSSTPTSRQQ